MNQESEYPNAAPRGRGRPRGSTTGSTRRKILKAATEEFSTVGFEAASIRSVARRAGVDSALVHHYFKDKTGLFLEALNMPVNPRELVAQAMTSPLGELGEALVRTVVTAWANPVIRPAATSLIRGMLSSQSATKLMQSFLQKELLARLGRSLPPADADRRAALAATQIIGMIIGRYIIQLEPLASMDDDEVVACIGPAVQWHLTGKMPS
ncbi:TetR family transcriptional regulator [Arthrobacter sp. MYb211]|uniref:TetR/AcrR family transcriptional regulator n=1 Tax=unclassified Arthrobacter TaxID=235627 RepID=UPI000CFAE5CE|nr:MULTISPECIES: TetR family transcriptional regulator [unclassified Arthrobacter]PRA11929.1 TetR family transcriptional regulator [Arthrobacter sp. MYb221]PRC08285.1 TetR family transcriptional regulator [Arthrobacter sp. MYb211]